MTMTDHRQPSFEDFFRALWRQDPFPWQWMLAQRVLGSGWPEVISLPTAAGKTACIDIALYALACQAEMAVSNRTAPRRIWFVVDRRIVVDAAYERAITIAEKLAAASTGPLGEISARLRSLSGTDQPLAVARLRGGIADDKSWARLPSQAAVITSTVDQLGSRLLFRNYASNQSTAPIYAALAANDSLIFLDEAHCSNPFSQTLDAVRLFRGDIWAEQPVRTPFGCVLLSATPPPHRQDADRFPGAAMREALAHPQLQARLLAAKRAVLYELPQPRGTAADPLIIKAQELASDFVQQGLHRIAVIVNRVGTAQLLAEKMQAAMRDRADVILLTGRLRPYERDELVARWSPYLRAVAPEQPVRPLITIATQCLEVGADFSFDALITEAASLDALRQRFGRLNRIGTAPSSPAAVLIRKGALDPKVPDPIYGAALPNTWQLLKKIADNSGSDLIVDFGVSSLDSTLAAVDVEELQETVCPAPDAPVLLPAHLDLLCQTSPTPATEPDVALFLHGSARGAPDAYVVWRADLDPDQRSAWIETIALCPPVSAEMLSVPLYRLHAWLRAPTSPDATNDIEGIAATDDSKESSASRPFLVWKGRDRSTIQFDPQQIGPGDVVVLPATYGIKGLGQATCTQGLGRQELDVWEPAAAAAQRRPSVRIQRAVLETWLDCTPLKTLVELAESPDWERDQLWDAVEAVLAYAPTEPEQAPRPPDWWLTLLHAARGGRVDQHPAGGLVLTARTKTDSASTPEPDLFADEDDIASAADEPMALEDHTGLVVRTVGRLASLCVSPELHQALSVAARWHDAGKLDERFQILLHQGDVVAAITASRPLAKSADMPLSPAQRRAIRSAAGLPEAFRHEMVSLALASLYADLPQEPHLADLALYLIASHHGYARPFAPICLDQDPPDLVARFNGVDINLSAQQRLQLPPAHRLDSQVADRFWRNVRRYGWWGLAYLEAILRLADWYASTRAVQPVSPQQAVR